MNKNLKLQPAIICALLLLSAHAFAFEIGDVVDDFTLTDLAGQDVSLSDHAGEIIVLNFFTTWCPGCNEEAGHLENEVWLAYADRGVTVIAIDVQEQLSLVQGWAAAMGVTYPIWMTPDWDLFQLFPGAIGLPYNAVLDQEQTIRYASMGFNLLDITSMIGILLEEGQVPVTSSSWDSVKAMYRL